MNVVITIGITLDNEEIVETIDAQVKTKMVNGEIRTVVFPANILSDIQNDVFDDEDHRKKCHQLVDDLFKAYKGSR